MYDTWSDGPDYLRLCLDSREADDRDALQRRITEYEGEAAKYNRMAEDLKRKMASRHEAGEDFIRTIVKEALAAGVDGGSPEMQRGWLVTRLDSVEQVNRAMELMQEEDGWGGD